MSKIRWTKKRVMETEWKVESINSMGTGYPFKVYDPVTGHIAAQTMSKIRAHQLVVELRRKGCIEEG